MLDLTTPLLWLLACVGLWNAINALARLGYGAPWWPYLWHIIIGAWAAIALWLR